MLPWLVVLPSAVLHLACSNDPVESEIVRKTIGPEGGLITSADGVLTVGIRPNTLAEPTELSIQRSNEPPRAWGPAYRVRPDIDLPIAATLTYRDTLPHDPSTATIGAILLDDFQAGRGNWVPLPVVDIDEDNEIVRSTDRRLSMFYALMSEGGMPSDDTGTTGGGADDDVADTGDGDSTGGTTQADESTGTSTSTTTTTTTTTTTSTTTSMSTDDTTETTDTGGVMYPPQCQSLYMGPFSVIHATGMPLLPGQGSEDLAMTGAGTFVAASGTDLLEIDSGASATLWASDVPTPILGARFTAQGELLIATHTQGSIQILGQGGTAQLFADGFGMPNGIYPDAAGNVWVTDLANNQVVRIDPNRNRTTIASGATAAQANGIIYDDLRNMVFWTTYSNSELWRAPIDGAGMPGEPVMIIDLAGTSDGITLDVCGNIYVVDYNSGGSSRLDRVFLDEAGELAGPVQEIAGTDVLTSNCSNAQFGYGFGAYEEHLFVVGPPGNVYLIDLQIEGHPIAPL